MVWLCGAGLSGVAVGAPDAAVTQRVNRLDAAVRAEEGVRAVKRLQNAYAHYLDAGLWDDARDLFTADAVAEWPSGMVVGREAIREQLMREAGRTELGLARGQLHAHLILQPIVTLDGTGTMARGTWHEVALLGRFGASAEWAGGIYENEYVQDGGVWKIRRLRFFAQYRGAYDDNGQKAPPKWAIPYHFEAAHVGVSIPASALRASPAGRGSAAARAAALAERAARLNDATAVQNLQNSYGYYLDRKRWDDVADLFADDGTLEIEQRGVYVGNAHIRLALEAFYGAEPLATGELFDHLLVSPVVTVAADGAHAAARSVELAVLGRNGEYARWQLGTYENEFVKQNGVWKLRAVRYFARLSTDYDLGWAKDARPPAAPGTELPPDRPPSQGVASFPEAQTVALHFVNPVTGRPAHYPAGRVARVREILAPRGDARAARSVGVAAALATAEPDAEAAIAVDAVENLNSSYGYYLDESAWDAMADTFAATAGAKEISGAGVYVGRERIRAILNLRGPRGGRSATFFTIHQLTQPVIHVAADGMTAKARFRLFQGGGFADGSSGAWIGGLYENTAVKEDGEWKFAVQDLTHTFNASYRGGWARVGGVTRLAGAANGAVNPRDVPPETARRIDGAAAAAPRFVAEMPPDRPIRARQYAFPEIVEPAFHYRNPVSGRAPRDLLP